jgi:hypothetical protein
MEDARAGRLLRLVRPATVGDVVEIKHALPGRLRLALRRDDPASLAAVVAALGSAGGAVEGSPRAGSLLVRHAPGLGREALLGAPLGAELPPPRASNPRRRSTRRRRRSGRR